LLSMHFTECVHEHGVSLLCCPSSSDVVPLREIGVRVRVRPGVRVVGRRTEAVGHGRARVTRRWRWWRAMSRRLPSSRNVANTSGATLRKSHSSSAPASGSMRVSVRCGGAVGVVSRTRPHEGGLVTRVVGEELDAVKGPPEGGVLQHQAAAVLLRRSASCVRPQIACPQYPAKP